MALEEPSPEQASGGASLPKGRTGKMPERRRWFVENRSQDAVLSLRLASWVLQSKADLGFMTSCSPRGKVLFEHG